MPSPIGHTLSGLILYRVLNRKSPTGSPGTGFDWKWMLFFLVLANLPDLDFIVLTEHGFRYNDLYHHGPTHSVGFAAFCGLVSLAVIGLRRGFSLGLKAFGVAFAAVIIHVVLDYFGIDTYSANGIGVPLLFPFRSDYYIFPYAFFPVPDRSAVFSLHNAATGVFEVLFFGLVLFAVDALFGRSWIRRVREGFGPKPAPRKILEEEEMSLKKAGV